MLALHRRCAAVALGAAAVAASLVPPAPSYAAETCTGNSSVQVVVTGDISGSRTITPDQLCAMYDISNPQYEVRNQVGGATTPFQKLSAVVSIQKLVTSVQIGGSSLPLDRVTFVQLSGNGRQASLDEQQVRDPGAVFQGGLVPAVWFDSKPADLMNYIRPLMGPNDANGSDLLTSVSGGPLEVDVHTSGTLLHPSITATPSSVDAGARVAFSVSFADPQPSGRLQYHWDFGDGTTSTKTAPKHKFTAACVCGVHLEVDGSDTSSGAANVSIQVGPAPTKPPTAGPTNGPTSPPTSPGGHEGGPTSGPTSAGPTTVPTTAPTATSGPTEPTNQPSPGASQGQVPGPTSDPSGSTAPRGSDGREVAGQLLLAGQVYAVPDVAPAPSQAAQVRPPDHLGRSWWWALSLVFPLLIGLGVAGEAVHVRRRVARMGA